MVQPTKMGTENEHKESIVVQRDVLTTPVTHSSCLPSELSRAVSRAVGTTALEVPADTTSSFVMPTGDWAPSMEVDLCLYLKMNCDEE